MKSLVLLLLTASLYTAAGSSRFSVLNGHETANDPPTAQHLFRGRPGANLEEMSRPSLQPRNILDDIIAIVAQGLEGILAMFEGNAEEALTFVQNMLDMLLELQAQSAEDWEQQLIDMALQSLGTILGQIEDILGISPGLKTPATHKDIWSDILMIIEEGLAGVLAMFGGNLEESLTFVQNMLDMLLELQAQSAEDWEQQLIDMALQSLGTILGQIEDMLGIAPDARSAPLDKAPVITNRFMP
jgi:hypothetical protein